jgi:hypothetical protein
VKISKYIAIFGLLAMLAHTTSLSIRAQVAGGTLSGTVTDKSGAVIPNAQISIRNVATGLLRNNATDSAGFYAAPNLLAGAYEITISCPGFATQVRTGINLTVGAQQVLNISMEVGQVADKVEVTAEAPEVELATSSIGAVVNSTTVRELPLNGRSWTDLATLQPGVSPLQNQPSYAQGSDRGNRGYGSEITVGGARPQEANYRLDGISINDYTNGAPGSVLGGDLGVDAIEEFSVITSNYSAEYGKTSGGVINAVTRSGTNAFHGDAYEFLRNSALDARNFFDGPVIPGFRRNQFGASAGGPISKDKLFVFGDYEGIRQSLGTTSLVTVPSAAARQGILNFSDPTQFPTGCVATSVANQCQLAVDPSVQKYLPFWPVSNAGIQPGTNGNIGLATFTGQQITREDFFTARVDDRLSSKDSLSVTYLGDITPFSSPDNLNAVLINDKTNRQIVTLEETHVFSPALVNSARIGYSGEGVINNSGVSAINPLANDPSLAAIPGQFAAQVSVQGLTLFAGGVNGESHFLIHWHTFQAYDDAFWTHGTHSVKFGGAVERLQYNHAQNTLPSGTFTFDNLQNFFTNTPSRFQSGALNSVNAFGTRQTIFGLYIQDDWRLRSNLTVNLGLRYEMATVPTDSHGKLSTLINITDAEPHCGAFYPGCAGVSPLFSNPTLHNFAPRVGFSWDPLRDGKMAVRAGFGMYDVLPLTYEFLGASQYGPWSLGGINSDPTKLKNSFYAGALGGIGPSSKLGNFIEQHPHRNYVMQWNLNVQREVLPSVTALLGYVGSSGVHLPVRVNDMDIVIPTKVPEGYIFPVPVASAPTINPNFHSIAATFFGGTSSYHALEAGIQKAMKHGLQIQGSFTWAKGLDTGSATRYGDQFNNSISALPWYDLKSIRGLTDFNISRTLVISGTWQVPSVKSFSGIAARIANGWELGGIYKASDGAPFTATFGSNGDPQGLNSSQPWDFPNRLTGPGCQSLVNPANPNNYIKTECFAVPSAPNMAFWNANCDKQPFQDASGNFVTVPYPQCFNLRGNAGRNILIGPGTSSLDVSIFKNNRIQRISENFNAQFRAEFFNVLNRANFAQPITPDNTDIFDPTGQPTGVAGLLTSTTTTAREIQFALKLIW